MADIENNEQRTGMERVVEDLIQESMAKGEFRNLPGEGKPLKDRDVPPNIDALTYNLNKIVVDQGFAPEWVRLNGTIDKDFEKARTTLRNTRVTLGPEPLSTSKAKIWKGAVNEFRLKMEEINKKVDRLNFLVPTIHQQQVRFNIETQIDKINKWYLEIGRHRNNTQPPSHEEVKQEEKKSTWQELKKFFSDS